MELDALIKDEIVGMFRGQFLGSGTFRDVYEYGAAQPDNGRIVMKIEKGGYSAFANVLEFKIWNVVEKTKWAKWFAPCHTISANGRILLQARTIPSSMQQLPKKLPAFLNDTKVTNYGMYEGRFVCHDYGLDAILKSIFDGTGAEMKTVNWIIPE